MSQEIKAIKNGRIVKFSLAAWNLFPPDKYGWQMLGREPQAAPPVVASVAPPQPKQKATKPGRKPRK